MSKGLRVVTEIAESKGDSWVILRVYGDATSAAAQAFEHVLKPLARVPRCRVSVRFEDASFLDETVVGLLVGESIRAQSLGGQLKVHLHPDLRRRLRLGDNDDWSAGAPVPRPPTFGPMEGRAGKRPESEAG